MFRKLLTIFLVTFIFGLTFSFMTFTICSNELSKVGSPPPLLELEQEGAEIAKFLNVNLEGI